MLTQALHALVARPYVYDAVQIAAGASVVRRRLAHLVPHLRAEAVVLDIGAGTGLYRGLWMRTARYVCLDIDPLKLRGFRARFSDHVIRGDAAVLPVADAAVDVVACTLVAHHLADDQLSRMVSEVTRVLKPGGAFLFVDPVWRPARLPSRFLWRYDRGAHPRTADALRDVLSLRLQVQAWNDFACWHGYIAVLARKPV